MGRYYGPAAWENQPENFTLMGNVRQMVNGSYANRFLVCEGPWTPPRRTVRLDDDGRVLHEWFGGQAYGTLATPELSLIASRMVRSERWPSWSYATWTRTWSSR